AHRLHAGPRRVRGPEGPDRAHHRRPHRGSCQAPRRPPPRQQRGRARWASLTIRSRSAPPQPYPCTRCTPPTSAPGSPRTRPFTSSASSCPPTYDGPRRDPARPHRAAPRRQGPRNPCRRGGRRDGQDRPRPPAPLVPRLRVHHPRRRHRGRRPARQQPDLDAPDPKSGYAESTPFGLQRGSCPHRSEEHTSELQSRENLVCRLLLEKKNKIAHIPAEQVTRDHTTDLRLRYEHGAHAHNAHRDAVLVLCPDHHSLLPYRPTHIHSTIH